MEKYEKSKVLYSLSPLLYTTREKVRGGINIHEKRMVERSYPCQLVSNKIKTLLR